MVQEGMKQMLVATGKPPATGPRGGTDPSGGTEAQVCLVPKAPCAFLSILSPPPYSHLGKLGQAFKLHHFF